MHAMQRRGSTQKRRERVEHHLILIILFSDIICSLISSLLWDYMPPSFSHVPHLIRIPTGDRQEYPVPPLTLALTSPHASFWLTYTEALRTDTKRHWKESWRQVSGEEYNFLLVILLHKRTDIQFHLGEKRGTKDLLAAASPSSIHTCGSRNSEMDREQSLLMTTYTYVSHHLTVAFTPHFSSTRIPEIRLLWASESLMRHMSLTHRDVWRWRASNAGGLPLDPTGMSYTLSQPPTTFTFFAWQPVWTILLQLLFTSSQKATREDSASLRAVRYEQRKVMQFPFDYIST